MKNVYLWPGSSKEWTTRLELDCRLDVDVRFRPRKGLLELGVIAVHATRPRRAGTFAGIISYDQPSLRWNLAPGQWKVRVCSLYESEIVTEVGPWREIEVKSNDRAELELEWPARDREDR